MRTEAQKKRRNELERARYARNKANQSPRTEAQRLRRNELERARYQAKHGTGARNFIKVEPTTALTLSQVWR